MHGKYGGKPLAGWRYAAFVGSFVGAVGLVMYAVAVYPYLHIEDYQNAQKQNRRGIDQEKIQPGNMKVWSDPFDRTKK